MELDGARVVLVGATGELGGRLARGLADAGARLVVTGRDEAALGAIAADTGASSSVVDLVDLETTAGAVAKAGQQLGGLDAVVVAAGVAAFGPARDEDDAVVEELFAVNTFGPMAAVRGALPHLGRGGCVVVLTAVLADVPTAGMAAYSASKAAASAWLTALRRELRRDGIGVLDVRPPHLDTGLADRALSGTPPRMPRAHPADDVVDLVLQGMRDGASELVSDLSEGSVTLR